MNNEYSEKLFLFGVDLSLQSEYLYDQTNNNNNNNPIRTIVINTIYVMNTKYGHLYCLFQ